MSAWTTSAARAAANRRSQDRRRAEPPDFTFCTSRSPTDAYVDRRPRLAEIASDRPAHDQLLRKAAADRVACTMLDPRIALIAIADALCAHGELTGDEVSRIVCTEVFA